MGVTLKYFRVEGRHFHHTIITWVRIPPEVAFAYVADITDPEKLIKLPS